MKLIECNEPAVLFDRETGTTLKVGEYQDLEEYFLKIRKKTLKDVTEDNINVVKAAFEILGENFEDKSDSFWSNGLKNLKESLILWKIEGLNDSELELIQNSSGYAFKLYEKKVLNIKTI